jgi:hypothetical protein
VPHASQFSEIATDTHAQKCEAAGPTGRATRHAVTAPLSSVQFVCIASIQNTSPLHALTPVFSVNV